MALLAIALPLYNDEKSIEKTIQSVLAQTLQDFELHIYDNCSSDQGLSLVTPYLKDKRIFLHTNSLNVGMALNFNYCLQTAKHTNCKYVSIKSANDYIEPTYYEKCVQFLEENPTYVLAYTQGTNTASGEQAMYSYEQDDCWERIKSIVATQGVGNMNYGVLRADIIDKIFPIMPIHGFDHIFFLNLAILGKLKKIDEVLYHREAPTKRTEEAYFKATCSSLTTSQTPLPHHMNLLFGYITFCNEGFLNGLSKKDLIQCIVDTCCQARYATLRSQYKQFKRQLRHASNTFDDFMLFPKFMAVRHFLVQNQKFRRRHPVDWLADMFATR